MIFSIVSLSFFKLKFFLIFFFFVVVKLHPLNNQFSSNISSPSPLPINDINLQIPLSNLYSHVYHSTSTQSSFDDLYCNLDKNSETDIPITDDEEHTNCNILNNKPICYHIYKYSRRERKFYYSRIKHIRLKNHSISPSILPKKSRSNDLVFNQKNFLINIPTKINSQQRINSNFDSQHLSPLIFSPNFNTLVKLPINNNLLNKYFVNIKLSFHLLHSIASQEFQRIVHNYDNQHNFSFLNILRQTMINYSTNFNQTYKRNFFDDTDDDGIDGHETTNELVIPPLKIRRYDDSSYEIEKRSISSSSSGMSITQIHNGHLHDDRRRSFDTRHKKFPSRISDIQINSNSNDIHDLTVGSPLQNDLSINDYSQSKE